MERLTFFENGIWWIRMDGTWYGGFPEVDSLAAYEDTNLTPADINDLRNELCLKCGKYKDAHLGTCDGCRWRKDKD